MNVAIVARDLSTQKIAELAPCHLSERLERRIEQRTVELCDANTRLLDHTFQREQADLRFHNLRNRVFHSVRLSAAVHLAAVLAHELDQPLTALINSVNAIKRLLTRGDDPSLVTVLDVADEADLGIARERDHPIGFAIADRDETERRVKALPSMIEEAGTLALSSVAPAHGMPLSRP